MKIMLETTQWDDPMMPNHVYVFKDKPTPRSGKAIAYVKAGTTLVQKFAKPMDMDLRNRTFIELTDK